MSPKATLLDEDGALSAELEKCLAHIFGKYCTPTPTTSPSEPLLKPLPNAYMTAEALDQWAKDTNGSPLGDEAKEEILENLDVTEEGYLTLEGYLQLYSLQTSNDEEETWNDLKKHGFDENLHLVVGE